jgi:CheY-like chemotaxis protein
MEATLKYSLLLVEDDLNDIFLIKRAFKLAGIQDRLHIVTDGEQAIDYLRGRGAYADRSRYPLPKLMVMDIRMPRLSGFEVLHQLKNDPVLHRVPIVIVSASDNPADINRAYELGANAYMIKPVDFRAVEDLFEAITRYWGSKCAAPDLELADHG